MRRHQFALARKRSSVHTKTLIESLESRVLLSSTLIPVTTHRDLVFDSSRNQLLITTSAGTVERYDLGTNTLLSALPVGTSLMGADITPDGKYLYAPESSTAGTVHKVDLATGAVTNLTYSLGFSESGGYDLKIASNNKAILTTDFAGSGWVPLRQIDLSNDAITQRTDSGGSGGSGQVRQRTIISRSADRGLMYFEETNSSAGPTFTYSAASNNFPAHVSMNTSLSGIPAAVSRDGSLVAIDINSTMTVMNSSLSPVHAFTGIDGGLLFDSKHNLLYGVNSTTDQVIAFSTIDWQQRFTIPIGENVTSGTRFGNGAMSISSDATKLFLSTPTGVRMLDIPQPDGIAKTMTLGRYSTYLKSGVTGTFTVSVKDAAGENATGYRGTISFSSNDNTAQLPANYTFTAADAGVHTFNVTFNAAGARSLSGVDAANGLSANTGNAVTVHFPGTSVIPITNHRDLVFDGVHNRLIATTSAGTIEQYDFNTESLLPSIPVSTSLFGADLSADGNSLYVADNVTVGTLGFFHKVDLTSGAVLDLPYTRTNSETGAWDVKIAGNGIALTATQYAGAGNVLFRQINTGTNVLSNRGDVPQVGSKSRLLLSADRSTLVVADTISSSGTVRVYKAGSNTFVFSADTQQALFGPTAVNRDGSLMLLGTNVLSGDLKSVTKLPMIDGGAVFDPQRDVLYGVDSVANQIIAFDTKTWQQKYTIPVGEDVLASAVFGNGAMSVSADSKHLLLATATGVRIYDIPQPTGVASSLVIGNAPTFIKTGVSSTFTVTARDPAGDAVPGYRGTVHFSSNDAAAGLPANYTFTAADQGVHTFSVTFNTTGTRSITASDATNSLSGSALGITVHPPGNTLIPVPDRRDIVYDPQRNRLYITTSSGKVERYDIATETLLSPYVVSNSTLNGADITADGSALYVADGMTGGTQGFFHKINLTTGQITDLPYTHQGLESGAWDVKIASDGKAFVTTSFNGSGSVPFRQIDLATDTISVRNDQPGTTKGFVFPNTLIARNANRNLLFFQEYLSNGALFTYSGQTDTFPGYTATSTLVANGPAAVNRDGSLILMPSGKVINASTFATVTTLSNINGGGSFDPVRDQLYAVDPSTDNIDVYNTNTWAQVSTIPVGELLIYSEPFTNGMTAISNDGNTLFLTTQAGVHVIDLTTVNSDQPGLSFNPNAAQGVTEPMTVNIKKQGVLDAAFTGTIHFSSTDPDATLPADYTFTAADAGTHTFDITFIDTGVQSLTVSILGTTASATEVMGVGGSDPSISPPGSNNVTEGIPGSIALGTFTDQYASDGPWSVDVDWGDGSAHTSFSVAQIGSLGSQVHTYEDSGSVQASLTVTDRFGNSGSHIFFVNMANANPSATFSNNGPVTVGSQATVSFTNMTDPSPVDTAIGFTFSYDFNNDGVYEISHTTASSVTVPSSYLTTTGPHTVAALISDKDGGFAQYTTTIQVNPVVPAGGSISGTVYNDVNNNAKRDSGELGVSGVTVYNDANNNSKLDSGERTTTTDANGLYLLSGLSSGAYKIRQILQTGWAQTTPANSYGWTITLATNQQLTGKDFGTRQSIAPPPTGGSIAGVVWNDLDGDGVKDSNEIGVANVTVYDDANNNSKLDTGERTTITDAGGNYILGGLSSGSYKIREILQSGWSQTTPANNFGWTITLASNQQLTGKNFGTKQSGGTPPPTGGKISGTIFNDLDGDGVKDSNEIGVASGWMVYIDLDNDSILDSNEASTTTDANGNWSLSGLAAGTYKVRQVLQSGWKQTTPTNNYGLNVTLTTNQSVSGKLFGSKKIA